MSRRRRPQNNLLKRMIVISVGVNAVLLPVLAQLGVFKKVSEHFSPATVVLVPAEAEKSKATKEEKKKEAPKPKTGNSQAKTATAHKASGSVAKANPNAPKVVTSAGAGDGTGEGPAVESGTGAAGKVPLAPPSGGGSKEPPKQPDAVAKTDKQPAPTEKPAKPDKPVETVVKAPEHKPVYAEPEVESNPYPVIPESLRDDALNARVTVLFDLDEYGHPLNVSLLKGSGIKELDDIALSTAKKWTFKPATLDGAGTRSKVKLNMEFVVE